MTWRGAAGGSDEERVIFSALGNVFGGGSALCDWITSCCINLNDPLDDVPAAGEGPDWPEDSERTGKVSLVFEIEEDVLRPLSKAEFVHCLQFGLPWPQRA